MMYSNLSKGYPTFTHFPAEDQEMWFRQFAQEFTWNPDHTNFIRDVFVHKVMDNYRKVHLRVEAEVAHQPGPEVDQQHGLGGVVCALG